MESCCIRQRHRTHRMTVGPFPSVHRNGLPTKLRHSQRAGQSNVVACKLSDCTWLQPDPGSGPATLNGVSLQAEGADEGKFRRIGSMDGHEVGRERSVGSWGSWYDGDNRKLDREVDCGYYKEESHCTKAGDHSKVS